MHTRTAVTNNVVEPTIKEKLLEALENKHSLKFLSQTSELLHFLNGFTTLSKELVPNIAEIQTSFCENWIETFLQNSFQNLSSSLSMKQVLLLIFNLLHQSM